MAGWTARQLETARSVDVLYTTESLDEVWPLLRELTALELPSQHFHEGPKAFGFAPNPVTLLGGAEDNAMETLTKRVAPCDWKLYELASESAGKILGEWRKMQASK